MHVRVGRPNSEGGVGGAGPNWMKMWSSLMIHPTQHYEGILLQCIEFIYCHDQSHTLSYNAKWGNTPPTEQTMRMDASPLMTLTSGQWGGIHPLNRFLFCDEVINHHHQQQLYPTAIQSLSTLILTKKYKSKITHCTQTPICGGQIDPYIGSLLYDCSLASKELVYGMFRPAHLYEWHLKL